MFRSLFRARSFLIKAIEFKITKNIKGPLWQCGSIRLVCKYGVLCGDASWTSNFKLSDFNEETTSFPRMIWIQIETCWSVLSVFKCFNINVID